MYEPSDDPKSLSFIDCVSCGLAAALFLFLVFAAVPRAAVLVDPNTVASTGSGLSIEGSSGPPVIFAGNGSKVPVDIEIKLNRNRSDAYDAGVWRGDKSKMTQTSFRPEPGRASVFVASLHSDDPTPEFRLRRSGADPEAVEGSWTIRAGNQTAQGTFACPAVAGSAPETTIRVLFFDGGASFTECRP